MGGVYFARLATLPNPPGWPKMKMPPESVEPDRLGASASALDTPWVRRLPNLGLQNPVSRLLWLAGERLGLRPFSFALVGPGRATLAPLTGYPSQARQATLTRL